MPSQRLSPLGLLLLAGLALGWGINWPVMKLVLSEVPPLTFRGLCLVIGGVGIFGLARAAGHTLAIPEGRMGQVAVLVVTNIIGWNIFATYGVMNLPSGRAALLGYTMPLWCVPLSVWLLHERLDTRRILALLLGLAGVAVLMGENILHLAQAPVGIGLMVAAAWCWALGMVLMKRFAIPVSTVVLTGWQMLLGGLPLLLAACVVDGLPVAWPSAAVNWGLIYNVLVGFMFGYWAWNKLVLLVPISVSSLSSLITPLVGILAGAVMLGEQPGWPEAISALLILGAVAVINTRGRGAAAPQE